MDANTNARMVGQLVYSGWTEPLICGAVMARGEIKLAALVTRSVVVNRLHLALRIERNPQLRLISIQNYA
jgi:hypothetical protein